MVNFFPLFWHNIKYCSYNPVSLYTFLCTSIVREFVLVLLTLFTPPLIPYCLLTKLTYILLNRGWYDSGQLSLIMLLSFIYCRKFLFCLVVTFPFQSETIYSDSAHHPFFHKETNQAKTRTLPYANISLSQNRLDSPFITYIKTLDVTVDLCCPIKTIF